MECSPGRIYWPSKGRGVTVILVVDDDDSVRTMLARLLRTAGHEVVLAKSVAAAREMLVTQVVELIVSDIVMPGASGIDLRRWLAEHHPSVPVILTSGYSPDGPAEFAAKIPGTWFLQKPFGADELLGLVRDVAKGNQDSE